MSKNKQFSMKLKMAISFSLVAVLLISLFGIINYYKQKTNLHSSIIKELTLNSEINSQRIDSWMNKRIASLETRKIILKENGIIELILSDNIGENIYLKGDEEKIGNSNFYIGTPDKRFLGSDGWIPDFDYDPTVRPWYTAAVKKRDTIITDYYIDATTGTLTLTIASPVYDNNNTLLCVLGVDLYLDEILKLVNLANKKGISAALIDNKGITIAHPQKDLIGKSILDLKDDENNIFMENVVKNKTGSQEYNMAGEKKNMVYKLIPSLNWVIVLFATENYVYAPLKTIKINTILFILGTLIIFIIFVYFISNFFVNRIQSISLSLKDISEGEGDLTKTIKETSNDELTFLAQNFNIFIKKLKGIITNIKTSSVNNNQISTKLNNSSTNAASASLEITKNVETIGKQIKLLDNNINETTSGIYEISSNISQFKELIEEQSSAVEESSASIEEMIASLDNVSSITNKKLESTKKLVNTTKAGEGILTETSSLFKEGISDKIGNIKDMVEVISHISERTNLLAMNAAIEAAHAGDAGKGFAVVADEIRKMAEESASSSKSISEVIAIIINAITTTDKNIANTSEAFSAIFSEVAEIDIALNEIASNTVELASGGHEILEAVSLLNDTTANISNGVKEIEIGTKDITGAMVEVQNISSEVFSGVNEITIGMNDVSMSFQEVSNLADDLGQESKKLTTEVNRFII